ncbi:MAG: CDP-alcohol phosphatidyltransferase family protein, partial [Bacteroidales bacterium]
MKKHIPNFITCLNIICGCISIVNALKGNLPIASLFIVLAAVFDFLDGFSARLLKVQSDIGVDMDSLADVFSFGGAPAMIIFVWMEKCIQNLPPDTLVGLIPYLPYCAFIVPAFSALRLAKFNHDERQRTDFIGLATPANALFLGFLHFSSDQLLFVNNFWIVLGLTIIFSLLLISELPMFSLKFKHFKFKGNEVRYIFLLLSLILLIIFRLGAFPIIVLTYILISVTIYAIKKI